MQPLNPCDEPMKQRGSPKRGLGRAHSQHRTSVAAAALLLLLGALLLLDGRGASAGAALIRPWQRLSAAAAAAATTEPRHQQRQQQQQQQQEVVVAPEAAESAPLQQYDVQQQLPAAAGSHEPPPLGQDNATLAMCIAVKGEPAAACVLHGAGRVHSAACGGRGAMYGRSCSTGIRPSAGAADEHCDIREWVLHHAQLGAGKAAPLARMLCVLLCAACARRSRSRGGWPAPRP